MAPDDVTFQRRAVQPMTCLREAWKLVKPDYWLLLGVCFVGIMLGSMGPMGVLVGPTMCGIHLCLLRTERGLPITFSMLFKGFDYFLPSFVATLVMIVPAIVMMVGIYALMCGGMFAGLAAMGEQQRGGPPNEAFGFYMIGLMVVLFVGIMVISMFIHAVFLFTYPLIVDRELSGWEAVVLSFRAFLGNFFGVLGLVLLSTLLSTLGLLACYVGAIFFLPIALAMTTIAYRQVFPEREPPLERMRDIDDPDDDEPQPKWSQPASTDIVSERG